MKILLTGGSGFIGTNLVSALLNQGHDVINADRHEPLDPAHLSFWRGVDILDQDGLIRLARDFSPGVVLHLAARTDCDENTTVEAGYRANTEGTANVLAAIRAVPGVERVIITSSQYVCGPDHFPKNMEDYGPHTVYGHSKVITERLTRQAGLPCTWTIVRPTNIWGPWHQRYQREAWRVIQQGYYLHPAGAPVVRCYGYVGNVVEYMLRILSAERGKVDRQTFYLSDPPADIYEWVNEFSLALRGRPARRVPRWILRSIAKVGDGLVRIGRTFPLTTSRFHSMTSNYLCPVQETYDVLGMPPVDLKQGVRETVAWLRRTGSS